MNRLAPSHGRLFRALWLLAAGLVVVQLLLLQQQSAAGPWTASASPRMLQYAVFGVLAFLVWIATGARWPLVLWAIVVLVGAIDDTQAFRPAGRSASVGDLMADGAAAPAALLALQAATPLKKED
jgi:hypothetical protein